MHKHTAKAMSEHAWSVCVVPQHYFPFDARGWCHDGAAHYGITAVAHCDCGAERAVEEKNGRRNYGPWSTVQGHEDRCPCCGFSADAPGWCSDCQWFNEASR